jgi:hypothetical protein
MMVMLVHLYSTMVVLYYTHTNKHDEDATDNPKALLNPENSIQGVVARSIQVESREVT